MVALLKYVHDCSTMPGTTMIDRFYEFISVNDLVSKEVLVQLDKYQTKKKNHYLLQVYT
jgi:hypothetical protein